MSLTRRSLLASGLALPAFAQTSFPSKPITIVVPYAAGGSTDVVGRLFAQALNTALGTTIVENRVGASGAIGWNSVAKGEADGHSILTTEISFAIAAGLNPNLPFNAKNDFKHITVAASVPHALVVNPNVPAKNLAEFIALLKAEPTKYLYGSGGNGTNTHLGFELFKSAAGVKATNVPYRGGAAALQDVIGGQVHAMVTALPTVTQQIKAGTVRALMVTSSTRSSQLPDVPSAVDVGFPQLDYRFWVGFSAAAKTSDALVERLNAEMLKALKTEDMKKRLADLGFDAIGNSPKEAQAFVNGEIARLEKIIKEAGIKAE